MAIDMLTRYQQSSLPRPTQARQIPGLAVDFFDTTQQFMGAFKSYETAGEASEFTDNALNYFSTEVKNMVIPTTFVNVASGIPLNFGDQITNILSLMH